MPLLPRSWTTRTAATPASIKQGRRLVEDRDRAQALALEGLALVRGTPGTLVMCGLEPKRVLEAIDVVVAQHAAGGRRFTLVPDYDTDNVSAKVLRIILSYTDYVNRTVWRK